jgi:hypothetical protein
MDCTRFDELVSLAIDGRLEGADRDAFEAHLASCPRCAREAAEARAAETLLENLDDIEPSGRFTAELGRRIDSAPGRSSLAAWSLLSLQRLVSVAAGVAIGVALAGAFHIASVSKTSAPRPAPVPAVAEKAPDEPAPELVRIAGKKLSESLNTFEAFNSDAHLLSYEEPKVAHEVLDREIKTLDIPDRIAEVRKYGEVYRRRDPKGWGFIQEVLRQTGGVVIGVPALQSARGADHPVLSEIRLRADTSLRRIDMVRGIYDAESKPPPQIEVNASVRPTAEKSSVLYVNGLKFWAQGQIPRAVVYFQQAQRKDPQGVVARRARDMMLRIYADMGRFHRRFDTVDRINSMLEEIYFTSPNTRRSLQEFVNIFDKANKKNTALSNIKIRIAGPQTQIFVSSAPVMLPLIFASISSLAIDQRPIPLRKKKEDSKIVLSALQHLPAPWKIKSRSYSKQRGREVNVVLVLPEGEKARYSKSAVLLFDLLRRHAKAEFALESMRRVDVTGQRR